MRRLVARTNNPFIYIVVEMLVSPLSLTYARARLNLGGGLGWKELGKEGRWE